MPKTDQPQTTHNPKERDAASQIIATANLQNFRFLLICCARRPFSRPFLICNAQGGTFTTNHE